jgi:ElaB/YqjD/DUF883 family membrane-anchored ribosome-binding protein
MGVSSFFKNLFDKANLDVNSIANQAETIATDAISTAKEAATPLVDKLEDFVEMAKEKAIECVPAAKETIENTIETIKEKANEYADKAEVLAINTAETVKEKISDLTTATKTVDEKTESIAELEIKKNEVEQK